MNTKKILLLSLFTFSSLLAQDSLYLYTVFHGENDQDQFGIVENVGDVNGDGFEDLLVGAPGDPRNLSGGTRHSYVKFYYGGTKFDTIPDLIFNKYDSNVVFGSTIAGKGDLNGDGFSDFAIADPYWGDYSAGKVYVYFGGAELDTIPDLEITLNQNQNFYTYFGFSMAMDGDINHDGYDDLVVGAPKDDYYRQGKVFIYFGGPNMDNQADISLISENRLQEFGISLDYIGDVNNDFFDDLLVGTMPVGDSDEQAYIFWGDKNNNIGFQNCYIFHGENGMATEVSSLGDINADGFNEFAFSAGGRFTVYFPPFDNGFKESVIYGTSEFGSFGNLTNCPDINGDGFDEIICGYVVGMEENIYIIYGNDENISIDNSIIIDDPENKILFSGGIASFSNLVSDTTISFVLGDKETFDYTWHGTGKVLIYNNDIINSIGEDTTPIVIKDFELYQNYPNPFNPSTTINYQIPYLSTVQLLLYDQLGREIKTLVSTTKPPGIYSTHLNTEDLRLASGVYFLRMTALSVNNNSKAFQKIIKLILTK